MPPSKSRLNTVVETVEKFVTRQRGAWEHEDWENLLSTIKTAGIEISDVTKRHIGNMLEAGKHFYASAGEEADSKPKAKAKPKAKPKAKAKAKAKPKAKAKAKPKAKKSSATS